MEIRHINPGDDLAAVSEVYEKSWKYAYRNIIPDEYLDSIPAGKWINGINKNERTDIIALDGGKIIGAASFCPSRWEKFGSCGEIVSVYLLPEYTGRSIGSELLRECIRELEWLGFRSILLWVLEGNVPARRFYEKHGFVDTGDSMDDNIGGRDLREIMYIRRE